LDQANIIVPDLRDTLPPQTEALLVDKSGRVIFPTNRKSVDGDSQWGKVVRAASLETSGTMSGEVDGEDSLFAFAPVQSKTDFIVVYRRPWRVLGEDVGRQAFVLAGISLFSVVLATLAAVLLSRYLTRPLELLSARAARLASGQHGPPADVGRLVGGDEL